MGTKTSTTKYAALLIALTMLFACASAHAGFKKIIGGVTISYSGDGADAYYDPVDGTLTVEVFQSGGSLNIVVGPTAVLSWGEGVDIYLLAGGASLKSINIKGSATCVPYVCGDVFYVNKFALFYGVIGNTVYYGPNYGLGMTSNFIPATISLKLSYCTAQLFGYPNVN